VDQEEHRAHIPVTDNGKAYCSTVKDHDNPYSVWSLSCQSMRDAIDRTPDDLFLLDEQKLTVMVNHDARLNVLRMSFHREYERVMAVFQRTGNITLLRMSNIYGGICCGATFDRYLRRPECLVYLTLPMVDFYDGLKSLGNTLLSRYEEILRAPLYDKKGNFNSRTAEVVLKAMKSVEDRVYGQSIQRVSSESKSVQVTVPVPTRSVPKTTDMMLVLEHRVKELSAELYGIRRLGEQGQLALADESRNNATPDRWEANRLAVDGERWVEKRVARMLAKEGEVVSGQGESGSDSDKTTSDN
jgi:hypothetical protein